MIALRVWPAFLLTILTTHETASHLCFAVTTTRRLVATRAQNAYPMTTTGGHVGTKGIDSMRLAAGDKLMARIDARRLVSNGKQAHIVMALSLQLAIRSGHRCLLLTMA